MHIYQQATDSSDATMSPDSRAALYDSAPVAEPERMQAQFDSFEFEAMTEVPTALAAYISHQHSFDL